MRILVYPHELAMGGSQLNAVEIAAGVRDLGHDVRVYGRDGVLTQRIEELGLDLLRSPSPGRRPSPVVVRSLRRHIAGLGLDVVHGYEWPPGLESWWATRSGPAVAMTTVMSMAVAPFIPRDMPLVVGTHQIQEAERRAGRTQVSVLEPPVDTRANAPDADLPREDFIRTYGLQDAGLVVVLVTRLARELKLEGVLAAMEAVSSMSGPDRATLVVVGDGPERDVVAESAARVNARCGRRAVVLTGALRDPRPAYAVADVALGMGGSALRALAFAKPLVVQGESGYWELLTPESLSSFAWQGWYGVGSDPADGPRALVAILQGLATDGTRRRQLGEFGLATVRQRYSLDAAARRQVELYEDAISRRRAMGRGLRSVDRRAARAFVAYKAARVGARLTAGGASSDDFNARPVAAQHTVLEGTS